MYGEVSLLKTVWLVIVVFMYIYNFSMNKFGIPFTSSKLITVFAIINLCFNPAYIPQMFTNRYYRFINGVIFCLLICILFLNFFINYSFVGGYSYPYIIILLSVECFLGGFYIVKLLGNYNITKLFNIMIIAVVIQAIIMIVAIFYNPLRLFIFETLKASGQNVGHDMNLAAMKFRGLALASDRKLGIGVFNGIICNIILHLVITLKRGKKLTYLLYGVAFILTFVSGMLAARTFYVVFLFLMVGLMLKSKLNLIRVLKFILFSLLLVFTIGAGALGTIADKDAIEKIESFSDWTFEAYNAYERTGEVKTGSSDDLLDNHWQYLPEDTRAWWLGGRDRTPVEGGVVALSEYTDSGYLLMLYYVGIIGCIAIYTYLPLIAWKANKLYLKEERMGTLIILIILLFYILEIKYPAMLGSYMIIKFIMLLYITGAERIIFFRNVYLAEQKEPTTKSQ